MASWAPTNPIEFTDEIKAPTHEKWNMLSDSEKKSKIQKAIEQVLLGKDISEIS